MFHIFESVINLMREVRSSSYRVILTHLLVTMILTKSMMLNLRAWYEYFDVLYVL